MIPPESEVGFTTYLHFSSPCPLGGALLGEGMRLDPGSMETERKKTVQKRVINTTKGPEAKGPYSTVVCHGNIAYVSGQGTLDPATGQFVRGSIEEQTERVLENLKLILEEIGSGLEYVLKTTVYLSDMDNFAAMNEVYARYMGPNFPARTCIQAGRLPFDMGVEIEVIAEIPEE